MCPGGELLCWGVVTDGEVSWILSCPFTGVVLVGNRPSGELTWWGIIQVGVIRWGFVQEGWMSDTQILLWEKKRNTLSCAIIKILKNSHDQSLQSQTWLITPCQYWIQDFVLWQMISYMYRNSTSIRQAPLTFGTSEHYGKAYGSLLSGWMNYTYRQGTRIRQAPVFRHIRALQKST